MASLIVLISVRDGFRWLGSSGTCGLTIRRPSTMGSKWLSSLDEKYWLDQELASETESMVRRLPAQVENRRANSPVQIGAQTCTRLLAFREFLGICAQKMPLGVFSATGSSCDSARDAAKCSFGLSQRLLHFFADSTFPPVPQRPRPADQTYSLRSDAFRRLSLLSLDRPHRSVKMSRRDRGSKWQLGPAQRCTDV